jgi:hypothetical protein
MKMELKDIQNKVVVGHRFDSYAELAILTIRFEDGTGIKVIATIGKPIEFETTK